MSEEPKRVYLVTSGEYSDYHIVAAFSTREAAETYCNPKYRDIVEEYELDQGSRFGTLYTVHRLFDGSFVEVEKEENADLAPYHRCKDWRVRVWRAGGYSHGATSDKSFAHARKLIEEYIQAELRTKAEFFRPG